jgi:hypothetical protein
MADVMHFASQVPERIGNGALAQSTIALVATLRQQISDRVIGIFDQMQEIEMDNYAQYKVTLHDDITGLD